MFWPLSKTFIWSVGVKQCPYLFICPGIRQCLCFSAILYCWWLVLCKDLIKLEVNCLFSHSLQGDWRQHGKNERWEKLNNQEKGAKSGLRNKRREKKTRRVVRPLWTTCNNRRQMSLFCFVNNVKQKNRHWMAKPPTSQCFQFFDNRLFESEHSHTSVSYIFCSFFFIGSFFKCCNMWREQIQPISSCGKKLNKVKPAWDF